MHFGSVRERFLECPETGGHNSLCFVETEETDFERRMKWRGNIRRRMDSETAATEAGLQRMYAYWRAANCLSVWQIDLHDNPLLKKPLTFDHRNLWLPGHWDV